MVGRSALIVIVGFSIIFGIAAQYWNRSSNRAMENFVNYYSSTQGYNIALSAANILADSVFWNQNATSVNRTGLSFGGGTYSMKTQRVVVNGDSDLLATVGSNYTGLNGSTVVDTIQILLHPARFSEYSFFTNNDNNVEWITGDSMTGPYHTNGSLYINGSPKFGGSVSTGTGLKTPYSSNVNPASLPDSHGDRLNCTSYQSGVIIPLPSTLANYDALPGVSKIQSSNTTSGLAYDVYMTFNGTNVAFHTTLSQKISGTWTVISGGRVPASGDSTMAISSLAGADGVILVKDGDVHVSGNMDGTVTLVAEQGGSTETSRVSSNAGNSGYDLQDANGNTSNGNVIIEGSTTYQNTSTDMLGLVANNSVMLKTQTSSVTIDAGVFAVNHSFFYQNYNSGSPIGTINLLGSLGQSTRGAVGTANSNGNGVATGYLKNYVYDTRFASSAPPYFPATGKFNILSWREKNN